MSYASGGEQLRLGICQSYFDAADDRHELASDERLTRFLARHQFGHALGLGEGSRAQPSAMARAIRSSKLELTVWSADVAALFDPYGYKPEGSIVEGSGFCLETGDGEVGFSPCSRVAAQSFVVLADRARADGGRCLVVNGSPPDASVTLEDCEGEAPPNALALRRARFGVPGHCVTPRTLPIAPGTPLETRPCADVGDPTQSFLLDLVDAASGARRGRIRLAAIDYCISVPTTAGGVAVATLEPCAASTVFTLGPGGDVSVTLPVGGRRCLGYTEPDSPLHLQACRALPFLFTGPLETADGLALSSVPDDPRAGLSVVALGSSEPPDANEVFDVHF